MARTPAQRAALLASPDDTEALFYEALQHGDLEQLMALWADDEEVSCVHPGGARIVGQRALRVAFAALFERGAIQVRPERVRRLMQGNCAIHQVLERIQLHGVGAPISWVIATNVYLKTPQGWRIALHHASPGSPSEVQELVVDGSTLH